MNGGLLELEPPFSGSLHLHKNAALSGGPPSVEAAFVEAPLSNSPLDWGPFDWGSLK
jgi:hypothetical protein